MKKIITLSILIFSFYGISVAQEDDSYTQTLKTMFEVSGSEETFLGVIDQMFTMYKSQYPSIESEFWDEASKEFKSTSMMELAIMLTPVYKKHLTQADLEELIAFYETPVGKKYASSTSKITMESMQVGQEWGMKMGMEIQKRINERK